jgi:hypothetical protein
MRLALDQVGSVVVSDGGDRVAVHGVEDACGEGFNV